MTGLDRRRLTRDLFPMCISTFRNQANVFSVLVVLLVLAPTPFAPIRAKVWNKAFEQPLETTESFKTPVPRLLQFDRLDLIPRQDRPALYEEAILESRQAYSRKQFKQALRIAERLALFWGQFHRPWIHLAAINLELGDWPNALAAAQKARDRLEDPLGPALLPEEAIDAAYFWEGWTQYKAKHFDEAVKLLQEAQDRMPNWPRASRALGEAAFVQGQFELAAKAYGRAFALDARSGTAADYSYYAEAIRSSGQVGKAIAALQQALRRFPYEQGLHANLGSMHQQEGNLTEAYYHFTLEAMIHGADGMFSQKSLDAVSEIIDVINEDEDNVHRDELLLVVSGLSKMRDGDPHSAIHYLLQATAKTQTTTSIPTMLLGQAHFNRSNFRLAKELLEDYLIVENDFVPAMLLLSQTYLELGQVDLSKKTRKRVEHLFPTYWKLNANESNRR